MEPFAIYLIVGAVISGIGIIILYQGAKKKKRCTVFASAVIAEIEKDVDEADKAGTRKKYTYTPIYEFTVNGGVIRKSGGIYSHNKSEFKVGDVSPVMYNPDKPDEFLVNGKSSGKSFGIALLLFGLVIIAIAFTQL